ncbi:MAG TPA: ectonucleotide pyrophosphatase/phosphodiesterase [Sphingomonas sp.]|jgi:predicted AlkP superfamily pyrophosphatase or phosphodiesterase
MRTPLLLSVLSLALWSCATAPSAGPARPQVAETRAPVTILVSIDGFRPDYLERGVTPELSRLAAEGASGPMRPSFPSKTFPNHWTLVTGLTPDRHGIVANTMEDARRPGEVFTMASDDPFWWNEAEPIWVTAEKAGIRTGTVFWPGSNVGWGGVKASDWPHKVEGGARPSSWQQYAEPVTEAQRVDAVVDLLRRPAATRPGLLTLYFEAVDTAGHQFGPDAKGTTDAVAEVDRSIGRLVAELAALGQPANLVITADHGMAATSTERTIAIDKVADPADYRVVEAGPYATFAPVPGRAAALERALLRPHPRMECWRKAEIPARLRYGKHPRVPPYLCLAQTSWTIAKTAPAKPMTGGNHGYDNDAPEMRALFIANGPAFRAGVTLPVFDNTAVASLLRELIGLPQAQGLDGTLAPVEAALRR